MKQMLKGLLVAALSISAAHATTHTGKTFFSPRYVLTNKAMEMTTWHEQINKKGDGKFGGSVQATVFYEESNGNKDLGRYFGHRGKGTGTTGTGGTTGGDCCKTSCDTKCDTGCCAALNRITVVADSLESDDLFNNDIFHHAENATSTPDTIVFSDTRQPLGKNTNLKFANPEKPIEQVKATPFGGSLCLRPRHDRWGVRLDWFQDLDFILNGLYFKISTAIVDYDNTLKASLTNSTALQDTEVTIVPDPQLPNQTQDVTIGFGNLTGKTIRSYFDGTLSQTADPNKQAALCKARIHCRGSDSETELADIQVLLGYNILNKKDYHFGLNLALVIPTSDSPNGRRLFEAFGGSGDHWAFGGGITSKFTLWESDKTNLKFLVDADYRFYFEDSECRTLGVNVPDTDPEGCNKCGVHTWWRLGGENGKKGTFPLANVLTRRVDVEPGSQFNGAAAFNFNWKGLSADLGYELYARERESVREKCWTDGRYGFADNGYRTSNDFDVALDSAPVFGDTRRAINKCDLKRSVAETPSQVSHKLFGGLGYAFNDWDYPLMFGAGASYEWAESNATLDMWGIWGKVGVSF